MNILQLLIGSLCIVAVSTWDAGAFNLSQGEHHMNSYKTIGTYENTCRKYHGDNWSCVSLKFCPQTAILYQRFGYEYSMSLRRNCGNQITADNYPMVCCHQTSNVIEVVKLTRAVTTTTASPALNHGINSVTRRLPTEEEGCGFTMQEFNRIVGGQNSHIGAWPWLALVGYNRFSLKPFLCGGTLITARHVLTAAHCFREDLSFVRLGEFNLSTPFETTHVDIDVNKMVKHPQFNLNSKGNDIGVLFLVQNVHFTDLIRPICMPVSKMLRSKNYVGYEPFIAGWGQTNENAAASKVLQQVQISVLDNSVCRDSYRKKRHSTEENINDSVLCTGVLEGGKDACYGDSGGPLMLAEPYKGVNLYYLIGVVSYGIGCAQVNLPGIYTSTRYFMDWIKQQIAEK